jgi:hypothetical protein
MRAISVAFLTGKVGIREKKGKSAEAGGDWLLSCFGYLELKTWSFQFLYVVLRIRSFIDMPFQSKTP